MGKWKKFSKFQFTNTEIKRLSRYCNEHSLKTTLARNKKNSKNPPPLTAESILSNLSHYIKKPRNRSSSGSTYLPEENHDSGDGKLIQVVDPFGKYFLV